MTVSNSPRYFCPSCRFDSSALLVAALLVAMPLALLPTAYAQNGFAPGQTGPALYGSPAPSHSSEATTTPPPRMPQYTAGPSAQQSPPVGPRPPVRSPVRPEVAAVNQHPLVPAIRWAHEGKENLDKIQDYSATVVKRERIGNKLSEYEYLFVKIRKEPFSVYIYFMGPAAVKGREVIYVKGRNDGKMWAHSTGLQKTLLGTLSLLPTGRIAMYNQRYPLTEIGLMNLVDRLIEIGERDMKYGECEVQFFEGAKINDRSCTCIQVMHPVPRRNFLFHLARIFVDDELNIPIRYEAHSWPEKPGGPPVLLEEYTYLDIKINNGFTDADFDIRNPRYKFR